VASSVNLGLGKILQKRTKGTKIPEKTLVLKVAVQSGFVGGIAEPC
jgi:hypothetical protein